MARISLGPTVTGLRGTIGGITFSANSTSAYAKRRAQPPKSRTVYQQDQRGPWSAQAAAWAALSSSQRTAWTSFAAAPAQQLTDPFGNPYLASAWNWFTTINVRLTRAGLATRTDPPSQSRPGAPPLSSLTVDASSPTSSILTYPSGTFAPNFTLVAWASVAPGPGSLSPRTRYTQFFLESSPGSTQEVIGPDLVIRFGDLSDGLKVFLLASRQTTDGLRSAPTAITTIVLP